MSSNTLRELMPAPLPDIDPIALGQAGLQALALAGTAIMARYACSEADVGRSPNVADWPADPARSGPQTPGSELSGPQWSILMQALGAFSEPSVWEPPQADQRRADAVAAMCLRARAALARPNRLSPPRVGPESGRPPDRSP